MGERVISKDVEWDFTDVRVAKCLASLANSGKRKVVKGIGWDGLKRVSDVCVCDGSDDQFGDDGRNKYIHLMIIPV